MSVHGNIYYVGRSQSPGVVAGQPLFSGLRHRKLLPSTPTHNHSRSTSCPKTQRSRYMRSIEQLRTMSPNYRHNSMLTKRALYSNRGTVESKGKQNSRMGRVKVGHHEERINNQEERAKSNSKQSSAFEALLRKKDVVKEGEGERKQKTIRFRKVQQPTKQKRVHWKTETQFKTKFIQFKQCKNSPSLALPQPNQDQIRPTFPRTIDSPLAVSTSSVQSSRESILQHYKLQPLRKLFLCRRCYQFTPIIELKSHYLNCNIPLQKEEFKGKWRKLISLLEECYRQEESNYLYRLIDRLKWYLEGEGEQSRKEGYILYSEELGYLLSLKGNVQVSCLVEEDLFWLIESLGDLIETKSLTLDETAFWKICT